MKYYPLNERLSKVDITEAAITSERIAEGRLGSYQNENQGRVNPQLREKAEAIAAQIKSAKENGRQVICAFGAHAIKNGLGPLLGEMLEKGWFTHLASNGAAVIHDWEFAWLGKSSEDVRQNVACGRFGTWEETGLCINLALACGAYGDLGYAASVGKMIAEGGVMIPGREELLEHKNSVSKPDISMDIVSASIDLYELIEAERIPSGFLSIPHNYSQYSLLAAAHRAEKPVTCHPMFGHDIIYTHRANRGAVIGRTAERDFLRFVSGVQGLDGGVYLSVGSAVMSPMIFEKALSMARNASGRDNAIRDCGIYVVDLQEASWDWSAKQGPAGGMTESSPAEPPMNSPAYYLRYMKTFSRMGCRTEYISADNRDFFICLYRALAGCL